MQACPVFLVGMPAAGKSTFGQRLANRLQVPFIDLDACIAEMAGTSVPAIFAHEGEEAFRLLEKEALMGLVSTQRGLCVVATGGGTPCFHGNMARMEDAGITVWLDTPLAVLAERIAAAPEQRPMFAHRDLPDIQNTLSTLYEQRLPFYRRAHYRFF